MKKQLNPSIKAHLIRSAFYVLLLLAVCMIPVARAQARSRGTRQSAGQLTSQQSPGQPTWLVPSAAASALAPKSVSNSSGNKAVQAGQSRAVDAASAALVPAYAKRSIQIQKS